MFYSVWMYSLGQGIDNEPVRIRQLPKSVSCCKNFTGREKLDKISKVSYKASCHKYNAMTLFRDESWSTQTQLPVEKLKIVYTWYQSGSFRWYY